MGNQSIGPGSGYGCGVVMATTLDQVLSSVWEQYIAEFLSNQENPLWDLLTSPAMTVHWDDISIDPDLVMDVGL